MGIIIIIILLSIMDHIKSDSPIFYDHCVPTNSSQDFCDKKVTLENPVVTIKGQLIIKDSQKIKYSALKCSCSLRVYTCDDPLLFSTTKFVTNEICDIDELVCLKMISESKEVISIGKEDYDCRIMRFIVQNYYTYTLEDTEIIYKNNKLYWENMKITPNNNIIKTNKNELLVMDLHQKGDFNYHILKTANWSLYISDNLNYWMDDQLLIEGNMRLSTVWDLDLKNWLIKLADDTFLTINDITWHPLSSRIISADMRDSLNNKKTLDKKVPSQITSTDPLALYKINQWRIDLNSHHVTMLDNICNSNVIKQHHFIHFVQNQPPRSYIILCDDKCLKVRCDKLSEMEIRYESKDHDLCVSEGLGLITLCSYQKYINDSLISLLEQSQNDPILSKDEKLFNKSPLNDTSTLVLKTYQPSHIHPKNGDIFDRLRGEVTSDLYSLDKWLRNFIGWPSFIMVPIIYMMLFSIVSLLFGKILSMILDCLKGTCHLIRNDIELREEDKFMVNHLKNQLRSNNPISIKV